MFPSGASNLTNSNDLTAGTSFNSLTVSGSGYDIGGASVTLGSIEASYGSGSSTVDLPIDWTGTGDVSVDAGAVLVLGGVITGTAGLTTQGAGEVDLTADNTYTGTTEVGAGILLVDGSQPGSSVTVDSKATLGGVGTVGSITASGGTVSPGDTGIGLLTDSGALTLQTDASSNNSVFAAELDGSTAGTNYSQLQVGGNIDLDGATLDLTLGSGFVPTAGESFTIIDNTGTSSVTDTFAGLPQGGYLTVSGTSFQISYQGGSSNYDVVLTEVLTSSTALTVSPVSPVSGQSVTLTATVTVPSGDTAPTGKVEFLNGTTDLGTGTLTNGVATLTTTALPVGDNSITADYSGDTDTASSTSTAVPVTVAATATSTTIVTFSPSAPVYGQSVTLTATVAPISPATGTPTGTVEFFDGTTELATESLSDGVATLDTSSLPIGNDSITAVYSGDSTFTSSTSTAVTVPIAKASSLTSLTFSPTSLVTGEQVTLTATVSAVSPAPGRRPARSSSSMGRPSWAPGPWPTASPRSRPPRSPRASIPSRRTTREMSTSRRAPRGHSRSPSTRR